MPIINLTDLRASLPRGTRLLGIDPGAKTIGLALTDVTLMLASPYGSLARAKLSENAASIARIARKEGVEGLVVGLPLSMDGSTGPAAQAARDWTHALSNATGLPAALWEADMTRKRRADVVDKMAAAYMLQAALDASGDAR